MTPGENDLELQDLNPLHVLPGSTALNLEETNPEQVASGSTALETYNPQDDAEFQTGFYAMILLMLTLGFLIMVFARSANSTEVESTSSITYFELAMLVVGIFSCCLCYVMIIKLVKFCKEKRWPFKAGGFWTALFRTLYQFFALLFGSAGICLVLVSGFNMRNGIYDWAT